MDKEDQAIGGDSPGDNVVIPEGNITFRRNPNMPEPGVSHDVEFREILLSLKAAIDRIDKKIDNKVESINNTVQAFQVQNIETQINHERRTKKQIEEHSVKFSLELRKIQNAIKQIAEESDTNIETCNNKILTVEKSLKDQTTVNYEILRTKIIKVNEEVHEKVTELNLKHDSLKTGIDSEIKKLRNRPISQVSGSDNTKTLTKQLKLPTYSGKSWEKPMNYIRELEEYFTLLGVEDTLTLRLIGQSLISDAKEWWIARRDVINTWEEFKTKFLDRFWGKETQRDFRKDLEFGHYKSDTKLTWSEYASRKFATAVCLRPRISDKEIVLNLIRHFGEHIVEAATCRGIEDIDALLRFLDEMQSGGRSNIPKPSILTSEVYGRQGSSENRVANEPSRQVSWRANPQRQMPESNKTLETSENRKRYNQPSTSDRKPSNWTTSRVQTLSEEIIPEVNNEETVEIIETSQEN